VGDSIACPVNIVIQIRHDSQYRSGRSDERVEMRKESKSNESKEKSETTRSNRSTLDGFDSSISRVKGGSQTDDDGSTDITTTTQDGGQQRSEQGHMRKDRKRNENQRKLREPTKLQLFSLLLDILKSSIHFSPLAIIFRQSSSLSIRIISSLSSPSIKECLLRNSILSIKLSLSLSQRRCHVAPIEAQRRLHSRPLVPLSRRHLERFLPIPFIPLPLPLPPSSS